MKSARERAEELAIKAAEKKLEHWSHMDPTLPCLGAPIAVHALIKSIADTLTPILEEIDAARKLIITHEGRAGFEVEHLNNYLSIRKLNEGL